MKFRKISAVSAVLILLCACKKDGALSTPSPGEKEFQIAVKLNNYMAPVAIDSAIATWEINGQVQQTKMRLRNDTLYTIMKNVAEGNGRLTLQVFAKMQLHQQKLQWERRVDLTLKNNESVRWSSPTNLDDPAWLPRVILTDQGSKFTAIVGLRPADPYFFLKNVPPGFKIELARYYVNIPGGALIVGGGVWKCNNVCTDASGAIENREFFRSLATQIGKREWKMVEISIGLFGDNSTAGPGFYFNHY